MQRCLRSSSVFDSLLPTVLAVLRAVLKVYLLKKVTLEARAKNCSRYRYYIWIISHANTFVEFSEVARFAIRSSSVPTSERFTEEKGVSVYSTHSSGHKRHCSEVRGGVSDKPQ